LIRSSFTFVRCSSRRTQFLTSPLLVPCYFYRRPMCATSPLTSQFSMSRFPFGLMSRCRSTCSPTLISLKRHLELSIGANSLSRQNMLVPFSFIYSSVITPSLYTSSSNQIRRDTFLPARLYSAPKHWRSPSPVSALRFRLHFRRNCMPSTQLHRPPTRLDPPSFVLLESQALRNPQNHSAPGRLARL
jgi:hypothetical protein